VYILLVPIGIKLQLYLHIKVV